MKAFVTGSLIVTSIDRFIRTIFQRKALSSQQNTETLIQLT